MEVWDGGVHMSTVVMVLGHALQYAMTTPRLCKSSLQCILQAACLNRFRTVTQFVMLYCKPGILRNGVIMITAGLQFIIQRRDSLGEICRQPLPLRTEEYIDSFASLFRVAGAPGACGHGNTIVVRPSVGTRWKGVIVLLRCKTLDIIHSFVECKIRGK